MVYLFVKLDQKLCNLDVAAYFLLFFFFVAHPPLLVLSPFGTLLESEVESWLFHELSSELGVDDKWEVAVDLLDYLVDVFLKSKAVCCFEFNLCSD